MTSRMCIRSARRVGVGLAIGVGVAASVDVSVALEVTGRDAGRSPELEVQDEIPRSNTADNAATVERPMARIVGDVPSREGTIRLHVNVPLDGVRGSAL